MARAAAVFSVAVAIALISSGCSHETPSAPHVADPHRVISLAPSVTETLIDLGLADRLVAISDYCPEVPGHAELPRVGGLNNLNVEAVLARRPDLVLTVTEPGDRTLAALTAAGVEVVASDPESLPAVLDNLVAIGERFGRGEEARALRTQLEARLAALHSPADPAKSRRPRLYVEIDFPPPWTSGQGAFVRDAVGAAGAEPLFEDLAAGYATVSVEQILVRDPDTVLILHPLEGSHDHPLADRTDFSQLRAVREGRVLVDPKFEALLHSSPRLIDGIELLARALR